MKDLEKGVVPQVHVEHIAPIPLVWEVRSLGSTMDKLLNFAQIGLCSDPGPFPAQQGL